MTNKHRNFDTMSLKVVVFYFRLKAYFMEFHAVTDLAFVERMIARR